MHGNQGIQLSMISRDPKLIGLDVLSACDRYRKHVLASAAGSTSNNLCEPVISGITAVVATQTLLSAMRQSLLSLPTPLPAATHWLLSQLARCTLTCTMILGTSRNCAIRRYNKSIHSKHFITEKRSEKSVSCS